MPSPRDNGCYANFCEKSGDLVSAPLPSVVYSRALLSLQRHQKQSVNAVILLRTDAPRCDDWDFRWIITETLPYLVFHCCFLRVSYSHGSYNRRAAKKWPFVVFLESWKSEVIKSAHRSTVFTAKETHFKTSLETVWNQSTCIIK